MKCAQGGIHSQTSRRPGSPSGRTARGSPPLSAPQGGHHQGAAGRAVGRPPPLLSPRLGARLGALVPRCSAPFPPGSVRASRCSRSCNHGSAAPGMRPEGRRGTPGKWRRRRREGTGAAPPQTPRFAPALACYEGRWRVSGISSAGRGRKDPCEGIRGVRSDELLLQLAQVSQRHAGKPRVQRPRTATLEIKGTAVWRQALGGPW